ncbi:MAG: hypothetical protein IPM23_00190 [Candidatus Melainabacteria bacterium]|nr:hypothetical protein [Candidatus Melainabacteria bacterium]
MEYTKDHKAAATYLLVECGNLREEERLLILCDETTADMAAMVALEGKELSTNVQVLEIPLASQHGQEPPKSALDTMCESDLIISLCKYSLAHTSARIRAGRRKARFLSMPCFTNDLFLDPAIWADYRGQYPTVRKISEIFTFGETIRVTTVLGTDISLSIKERIGNCCPGFVLAAGDLGSPPDIEANISPLETDSYGTVIVDGSITCPEIGLLCTPVRLSVDRGKIVCFESSNSLYKAELERMFELDDSPKRVLAECGVGLNPKARLTGVMLTDEGALGTMHFGFGANHTVGGNNKVDFHLDFVLREPTIYVDDSMIMQEGELII